MQREEFKRLGVEGDWDHPYTTMDFAAEAQIARELMKFAQNGTLYRGSKPVMWSVVEKTALAEAEVEYEDYVSDQVWVKFPVRIVGTPTRSGTNRKLGGQPRSVDLDDDAVDDPGQPRDQLLAEDRLRPLRGYRRTERTTGRSRAISSCSPTSSPSTCSAGARHRVQADWPTFRRTTCASHDLRASAQGLQPVTTTFAVPLLAGDHVTDDTGTGFVHTAPGHGREDFDVWTANAREARSARHQHRDPLHRRRDGAFTDHAPGFTGKRVLTDKGEKGDANEAVIKALIEAGMLLARGRLKHQYPHSWRSKKPVIFRNTPQWFIAMDKPIADAERQAQAGRHAARTARSTPSRTPAGCRPQGENRITGMVESKPDWVISRQRAWGVPITVFVREKGDGSVEILNDARVNERIADAFEQEGADAWYATGARERFLEPDYDSNEWHKVDDILDVWFDSGSTHAFVLEDPEHFPALAGIRRKRDGGADTVMYLEGSDQHRGWFQSSLLESCGTRGRAPFDVVLTHGFVLDEHGRKMSKSLGNVVAPQDVIKQSGADILRMWVCAVRLCRRSAHRAGNPQDHRRDLSQAAQHHPLDARLARAFPRGGPRRARARCRSSNG